LFGRQARQRVSEFHFQPLVFVSVRTLFRVCLAL
jgi:hypothetical protein